MIYIVYSRETNERLAEYKNKETLKGLDLNKCYFVESKPISKITEDRVGVDGRLSSGNTPHGRYNTINSSSNKQKIDNTTQAISEPSNSSDYSRNLAIYMTTLL